MRISPSTKLFNALGLPPQKGSPVPLRSALSPNIKFSTPGLLPLTALDAFGNLSRVRFDENSWGMAATRPIIAIITKRNPLEISGFCFRNCTMLRVFGINGGKAILDNAGINARSPVVELKYPNEEDIYDGPRAFIKAARTGEKYYFDTISKKTGRNRHLGDLEYVIKPGKSSEGIILFPIWDNKLSECLYKNTTIEDQLLKGIVFLPYEKMFSHPFYSTWITSRM